MMSIFLLHLKQIYRNIGRQRLYHFINIAGLLLGYYLVIWITVYVANETSYDDFHTNAHQIYRLAVKGTLSGEPFNFAVSSAPMAPALAQKHLIKNYTRIQGVEDVFLAYNDRKFYEEKLYFADSTFFELFSFAPDSLNPNALNEPFSIVLTQELAQKYFQGANPLGKKIRWNNEQTYTVTGVIPNLPPNTHMEFAALASFSTLEKLPNAVSMSYWGILNLYTYLQVDETKIDTIEQFLLQESKEQLGEGVDEFQLEFLPYLQQLTSIHLNSQLDFESGRVNTIENIYLFVSIAGLILIIVLINFVNLTTANTVVRFKEGAVRKILGASRPIIIQHYVTEAIVLSILALFIAMSLFELTIPYVQHFLNYPVNYPKIQNPFYGTILVVTATLVGALAGIYPAIFLSRVAPLDALKKRNRLRKKQISFRDALVLAQFTIAIVILIMALVVGSQLNFVETKHKSYDTNERIVVRLRNQHLKNNAKLYKQQFEQIPGVTAISLVESYPSADFAAASYLYENESDTLANKSLLIYSFGVDEDLLETLSYKIIRGNNFNENDSLVAQKVIINQTLLNETGWKQPLQKKIFQDKGQQYEVIGVIDDFVFQSLKNKISPMVLHWLNDEPEYMIISLEKQNQQQTLEQIRTKWAELSNGFPFDYVFLNKNYSHFYQGEQMLRKIMILLAILAFLIAGVGLYGIAVFITEQRTKEIGVRKVLGASTFQILTLFIRELTTWVFISIAVAWPLAYLISKWWLADFYYHVHIQWHFFILAGLLAVAVVWLTIMLQTLKIIRKNALDSLRYE